MAQQAILLEISDQHRVLIFEVYNSGLMAIFMSLKETLTALIDIMVRQANSWTIS